MVKRPFALFSLLLTLPLACLATRPAGRGAAVADAEALAGAHGAVATAHPLATAAALRILRSGGNAMDAAVAASFVLAVVRPQSTGIGGGGFLLWNDAPSGAVEVLDFRERGPLAATPTMFIAENGRPRLGTYAGKTLGNASVDGHLAIGTPGLVAGLFEAHRSHGSRPWAELVEPAIRIAEDGFPIYPSLADAMKERLELLQTFPGARQLFLRDGAPFAVGELLLQPDLAWTLRQIAARGAAGFYEGPVRDRLLAEMQRGGGLITAADLAAYGVKRRAPVEGLYHGYRVVSMPPPSSGGVHVIEMLNMLADDDLKALGRNSPAGIHLLAETMRRAFADRAVWLGDPDFVPVPVRGLLAPGYAAARRRSIDRTKATPSSEVPAGVPEGAVSRPRTGVPPAESPSTTHLSIMDAAGNAVASTQTVNNSFGSGVVAQGTGIVLNDEMDDFSIRPDVPNVFGLVTGDANAPAPLKTMLSSMSPTFVFGKDGKLLLAVGSPGGPRIISATLLTILNVLEYELPLAEAVAAPRMHHQWLPDKLWVEQGAFPADVLARLREMGHTLYESRPIGDVQAVLRHPAGGGFEAASDPRAEGEGRAF